ncbi:M81 family metallopeptidase [Flindersiella endophytica]
MVRLAALGLMHEANTFAPSRVDLAAFESDGILRGQQIVDRHVNARTTMAGFLAAAGRDDNPVEVVPLLFTTVTPAGPITADALRTLADQLVAALAEGGPWDGVLAALHGAAVAEECDDVDGYLLERFRSVVGEGTPIGAALDLHANISPRMAEHADLLVTYRTNPHVDAKERAYEVAQLVAAAARREVVPAQALVHVPAVIDILRQNTDASPMREILAALDRTLALPGVLTASVAEGYPYADVPELGMSVVVVADGDAGLAQREADLLAKEILSRRAELTGRAVPVPEAIRRAGDAEPGAGPVLLLDVGDNIGAGAPGDSVVLLDAARHLGLRELLCIIDDADAVERCWRAGVSGRVELRIGARTDPSVGPPLETAGTVRGLSLGRYEDSGATHAGQRHFDSGRTAVVSLDEGQTVVLTSRVVMPSALAQVTSLGLDPLSFRAIVAKGVHSPLAAYGPIAREVLFVDTPGVTSADLRRFPYRKARLPE